MARIALVSLVTALTLAATVAPASATTSFYVATTGSDVANNCQTQASPCATVPHAVTAFLATGDAGVMHIGPGSFAGNLALGLGAHPLTVAGAGSHADPATNTIINGVDGTPLISTGSGGQLILQDL